MQAEQAAAAAAAAEGEAEAAKARWLATLDAPSWSKAPVVAASDVAPAEPAEPAAAADAAPTSSDEWKPAFGLVTEAHAAGAAAKVRGFVLAETLAEMAAYLESKGSAGGV